MALKTIMIWSLESHLSSGMNHQLKIAKMVNAPKITPACHLSRRKSNQICVSTREGRTHEIECPRSDREEERRNLNREHDGVKNRGGGVKILGEATQPEL